MQAGELSTRGAGWYRRRSSACAFPGKGASTALRPTRIASATTRARRGNGSRDGVSSTTKRSRGARPPAPPQAPLDRPRVGHRRRGRVHLRLHRRGRKGRARAARERPRRRWRCRETKRLARLRGVAGCATFSMSASSRRRSLVQQRSQTGRLRALRLRMWRRGRHRLLHRHDPLEHAYTVKSAAPPHGPTLDSG